MATPRRPWYTILYIQVLLAIAAGILIGHYFSDLRRRPQTARRRLHLAHQNDDRPGDLLHRRARDWLHARPQEGRPGRGQDAVLFRGGVDGGAGNRAPGGRTSAAGQRLPHPSPPPRSPPPPSLRP